MVMYRHQIQLSKDEQEQARLWRIQKCGYDSFDILIEKFKEEVNGLHS